MATQVVVGSRVAGLTRAPPPNVAARAHIGGEIRVGISGWLYPRWRGTFYPRGLTHARELAWVASKLGTVEINGSFYSLQRPASYAAWAETTPPGFVFALKGSRFITHMKKLRDVDAALANFFASGPLVLGDKLGPVLWQLPPNLGFDPERLRDFFERLPRDHEAAARLARKHDARLDGRAHTRAVTNAPIRHAIEVRHPSFVDPMFVELLRAHEIGACVADTAGRYPFFEDVTAPFVYVRLHGDVELYASGYSDAALDRWAERIEAWRRGGDPKGARLLAGRAPRAAKRDVYVYFDNDAKVHAPFDAIALATKTRAAIPFAPEPPLRAASPRLPRGAARGSTGSLRSPSPVRASERSRAARG